MLMTPLPPLLKNSKAKTIQLDVLMGVNNTGPAHVTINHKAMAASMLSWGILLIECLFDARAL